MLFLIITAHYSLAQHMDNMLSTCITFRNIRRHLYSINMLILLMIFNEETPTTKYLYIKNCISYEPRQEKTCVLLFCICENKVQTSSAVTISTLVFNTYIVQSLFLLNPKFQSFSHLLLLYNPVCVGPDRKP